MAESDTILQLGIEAAREGNREEARNLFGLLTRQEPNNAQAWLWLAGVAEGPDQRRAALERVVELDPTNEMAIKGLQAMGVQPTPTTRLDEAVPPTVAAAPARDLTDEERYAQELDSAFDDYDALPRAEMPARPPADELAGDTLAAERPARTTPRGSARERSASRRASTPVRSGGDDDDDYLRAAPPRRGLSPLMLGLIGLIVAVVLCVVLYPVLSRLIGGGGGGGSAAATSTAQAIAGAATPGPTSELPGAGAGGTGVLTPTGEISGTNPLSTTTPLSETTPLTGTTSPEPAAPTAAAPAPAGGAVPPAAANPNIQLVDVGTELQANNWVYTFPNASYVLVVGKQVGNFTAQGNYIHVLVNVANNTGTAQPLPAGFFALKDAQNNVYPAQAQVSSALVQRGVNADVGMEDPIPANGVLTSVYLVFDVPSGAQNLTLFAAGNNGQGWQVLSAAP